MTCERLLLLALMVLVAVTFGYAASHCEDDRGPKCAVEVWKDRRVLVCDTQVQFDDVARRPLPQEGL